MTSLRSKSEYLWKTILDVLSLIWGFTIVACIPFLGSLLIASWYIPLCKIFLTLFGENFISKWALTVSGINGSSFYQLSETLIRLGVFWSALVLLIGLVCQIYLYFKNRKS